MNTVHWSWRLWRTLRNDAPQALLARYSEWEWTPLITARLLRVPLILEVHSPFHLERVMRGRRPSRLARWMDKTMWRKADLVWVHTEALRDIVAKEAGPEAVIRLIPYGVHASRPLAEPARGSDTVEVAFVGSFYPWHGVDLLLEAFARARATLPKLHLTLIGDGFSLADGRRRARSLGIDDAVAFSGWVDNDAVGQSLARAHLGVAPYLASENPYFEPVKIRDYQMAGLPMVASAVGQIPAMLQDGASGILVPPGDVGALAEAIVTLGTNDDLRARMGSAARAQSRAIDETAHSVLGQIQSIIART